MKIEFIEVSEAGTIYEVYKDGREIGFISEPKTGAEKYKITYLNWDDRIHGAECDSLEDAKQAIWMHEARKLFWQHYPELKEQYYIPGQRQNDYPANVRTIFVNWTDTMDKAGNLPTEVTNYITL